VIATQIPLIVVISLYGLAFIAQAWATFACAILVRHTSQVYRWAWLFLCLGFGLMAARRFVSLARINGAGTFEWWDAILSITISILLLIGVVGLKRLLTSKDITIDLLKTLSAHDPLTGCLNRVEISHRLSNEIERARRSQHPVAIFEFDIDHFKYVNDQYGHQVGDEVLIALVKKTKEVLRTNDLLGRIGGEEFLVVLPESNEDQAKEIAMRLCHYIAHTHFVTSAPNPIQITISIGVAHLQPIDRLTIDQRRCAEQIIQLADVAMYAAKHNGRNQVAVSH
jgi:diguanylate cyclase (GGDEF)-like protein